MYKHFFKRLIDIVLSLIGIVVLLLPMLIVAIIIKIDSPGPVLFKQVRVGLHKKNFTILKFRSMPVSMPKDVPTHMLQNAESNMSSFQKAIRKFSIDELPQLFCIFIGTMSIIGPRPALWNQDDLIEQRDVYNINNLKPGLTGWAQIHGRDELPIPVKVEMDKVYYDNMSFWFDIKCLFLTIVSVFKGDGVVEGGTGQMTESQVQEKVEEVTK